MANETHVAILKQGVNVWNKWREENPEVIPDLYGLEVTDTNLNGINFSGANLSNARLEEVKLMGANLREAKLYAAKLSKSHLFEADLRGAYLYDADLTETILWKANLAEADLRGAYFNNADLYEANLSRADLRNGWLTLADLRKAKLCEADMRGTDLKESLLIGTDLSKANMTGAHVFGISAWKLRLDQTLQFELVITDDLEPTVTVDNIEVAQFIYLILHNEKLRDVIDTITTKAVLILGRFTPERKVVLDAMRDALRQRDYVPILFDFEKPSNRDLTETISTLAHLARFVIADLTDPRSVPHELMSFVEKLPSVAVQPVIHQSDSEYAMFEHFQRCSWVLPTYQYESQDSLLAALSEYVIQPAEDKVIELRSGS